MRWLTLNCVMMGLVAALALSVMTATAQAGRRGKGGGKKAAEQPQQSQDQPETPPASQPSGNPALAKAESDLQAAKQAAQTKYESSAAWTSAVADLKSAQTDSDASAKPVLESVKKTDEYKAASAELDKAEAKMATLRDAGTTDGADMSAAASDAMTDRAKLRGLEKQAVSADPTASAAVQHLTAAHATMDKLRTDESATIAADPAVLVAQQAVDAAKGGTASGS